MAETLTLHCGGIKDGKFILRCTGRGEDRSPTFRLEGLSEKAKTLAVTLEDLSHPIKNFPHWVIWNLSAVAEIPGGIAAGRRLPSGAEQGVAYGFFRYAGPKPPRGKQHRYRFTVYVLDGKLSLGRLAGRGAFLKATQNHILQQGNIEGVFP